MVMGGEAAPVPWRVLLDFGRVPFELYKLCWILDGGLDAPAGTTLRTYVRHTLFLSDYAQKPVLFVDVDGVISLFGFREGYGLAAGDAPFENCPPGRLHSINGVPHYISGACAGHLERLATRYELVWATGWEETANDYLPHLLGLPDHLPYLSFDGRVRAGAAHWKIEAIGEYAGEHRPLAWIDDNVDESCRVWAEERSAPTLIIETVRHEGMQDEHVALLLAWADELAARR
jgi:hypothetical protein